MVTVNYGSYDIILRIGIYMHIHHQMKTNFSLKQLHSQCCLQKMEFLHLTTELCPSII